MVKYIFSLLFLIGITANAQTNYYVKNGGSDSNTGLSDGQAWATIGKADDVTFVPGDTLFLARGSTWKEIFEPKGDGTSDSTMVVIMDYGTGAKPIITGRDTISGSSNDANWTETVPGSSHIWYFSVSGMGFSVSNPINRLWINSTEVRRSETLLLINATDLFFYDSGTSRLYIYSTPNPGTLTNIEAGNVRTRAVNLYGDNYFKFYNIDFQGGMYSVRITGGSDGIVLDSCNVGLYTPGYGVATGDATGSIDNITIQNCTFDSGMEIKYEIASFYIPWTGVQVQYTGDNWEISYNYFKNWDYAAFTFIYLAGYDLTNLNFHHNEITSPDTYEGKPIGISSPNGGTQEYHHNYIHNVGVGSQMTGVGWKFYTNVIDTVRGAPIFSPIVSQCGIIISNNSLSDCKGIQVVNNTFANCGGAGIYLGNNSSLTENTENQFINNILYNNGAVDDDEQIRVRSYSNIHTNTFKNNLLYSAGITDLVNYRESLITVTEFNALNSNEYNEVILNNITGDPVFVVGTFELQETSPAVNAGIDVWLTTDYAGTAIPQGNIFDIGAYEFSSFPITITGLGWEEVLSKRNFKDDVNFAEGFSVEGVPIIFSGGTAVNIPGLTASASELNILDGATLSTTEINYVDGVTSAIQTQIDSKVNKADTLYSDNPAYYTQRQVDSLASSVSIDTSYIYAAIDLKADTVDQSFTGTTTISEIIIGDNTSNTKAQIDSLSLFGDLIYPFVGADTMGFGVLVEDRIDIDDALLFDSATDTLATKDYARTMGGGGGLDAGDVAAQINDTIVARLLVAVTGVRVADTANMLAPYFTEPEIRKADSDTIPLFIFGTGSGAAADTALFNNSRYAGAFYNSGSDTLHITELRGVLEDGTGTETISVQISWDVNCFDSSPTNLNSSALAITSLTSGTVDTSFNANDIPPGVWVWCALSGASKDNKPTMLVLTITGYKRNRSY